MEKMDCKPGGVPFLITPCDSCCCGWMLNPAANPPDQGDVFLSTEVFLMSYFLEA